MVDETTVAVVVGRIHLTIPEEESMVVVGLVQLPAVMVVVALEVVVKLELVTIAGINYCDENCQSNVGVLWF